MSNNNIPGLRELYLRQPKRVYKVRDNAPPKERGWLLPMLLEMDDYTWGRWNWWTSARLRGEIPTGPIPQIEFEEKLNNPASKMLESTLVHLQQFGVEKFRAIQYLIDWLLYGFGYLHDKPKSPCSADVFDVVTQVFVLGTMQLWPADYFGYLMSDAGFGESTAFFPTPQCVVALMGKMVTHDVVQRAKEDGTDTRLLSFCDPCVGTGRMLMDASNHSLRLYGAEINHTIHRACLINMYVYAPWAVAACIQDRELNHTQASKTLSISPTPHLAQGLTPSVVQAQSLSDFDLDGVFEVLSFEM